MTDNKTKHPVISAIAYASIMGGFITLFWGLILVHITMQQQSWPSASIQEKNGNLVYLVGEETFPVQLESSDQSLTKVHFNPEAPQEHIANPPSYWWYLYLSMAGMIVLYAGLHLKRERNRNVESLGFE